MNSILKKPVVSEKISELSEKGIYGFIVEKSVNKIEIKKHIEKKYNVKVDKVNTMIYPGKNKMRYKKNGVIKGRTSSYKKAIIYLKQGEVLDLYSDI